MAKLIDRGQPADKAVADLRELDLDVIAFDRTQGEAAGRLRAATRQAGLSLAIAPAWLWHQAVAPWRLPPITPGLAWVWAS